MKRLNKEFKLDICDQILLKYGSVNKDNPQIVYISGKCWVSPQTKMDYTLAINIIKKEMKNKIKTFLIDGENFCNKFILDFDINTDKMLPNEKKFLSFDLYLKQNENNKKSLKNLKEILNRKMRVIVNNLIYLFNENDFSIQKKK